MRAYRFDALTSLDDLHLHTDEPEPQPQRGEVLLRVRAVSLNYRDIAMPLGTYPLPVEAGHVPTSDGAAEVLAVGEGVTDFKPGDRVVGLFHPRWLGGARPADVHDQSYGGWKDGWLVERKVVSQEAVIPLPDGLSFAEGATLPCAAATAWTALAGPRPIRAGDTVLTQGTGGVSIFAVQLAHALGARVIATTSSAAKGELLRKLGADEVIDYRETKEWGARAKALTGGRGVDRVVEVGGPATIAQSLRAAAPDGEVVLIGFLGQEDPSVNFFDLFSVATIRSVSVGDRQALVDCVRAVATAGIRPVIDRVFGFDDAKAAFAHLAAGRHVGKVVIEVS
jgi:alcohol dehydrogenase